ncbi:beta-ketoacyl-ACP synthase, partial [Rhizobium ruizarguesonis]
DLAARERAVLEHQLPDVAIRGFGCVTGHTIETQFTLGLSLAALAVDGKAKVPPQKTLQPNLEIDGIAVAAVTLDRIDD